MNSLNLNYSWLGAGYGDSPQSSLLQESGSITQDCSDCSIVSSSTPGTSESLHRTENTECASERVVTEVEPTTRIRRPKNCFFQFLDEFTELHREEYDSRSALVKDAATVWKSLDHDDKEIFLRRAIQEELKHKETYPDYKYRPRKLEKNRTKPVTSVRIHLPGQSDSEKNVSGIKRSNAESLISLPVPGKVRKINPVTHNKEVSNAPVTFKARETKVEVTSKGLTGRTNNTTHKNLNSRESLTQGDSPNKNESLGRAFISASINEEPQHLYERPGLRRATGMAEILDTCIQTNSNNNNEQRVSSLSEASDLIYQLDLDQPEQLWW